jgi:hypothetical protein
MWTMFLPNSECIYNLDSAVDKDMFIPLLRAVSCVILATARAADNQKVIWRA